MAEVEQVQEPQGKQVEPGLYKEIPFDEYAEWDAVNATILNGLSRTPAHVRYELLHGGKEPTPSLDLGWLVHLAVLEPERFEAEVVVPPKVDRRTKVGKAEWAKFQAEHGDAILVDADTYAKVNAMAVSVFQHETAAEFFQRPGQTEISIVWDDKEFGLRCKARIDRVSSIGDWPIIGDLKTARNAARSAFERAIHNYGYHVQAVHYLAGLEALYPTGGMHRRFVFFVVESEAPYLCAAYELDEAAIAEAETVRRRHLATWKQCIETGNYPGYPQGIDYVSLPPWAFKNFIED